MKLLNKAPRKQTIEKKKKKRNQRTSRVVWFASYCTGVVPSWHLNVQTTKNLIDVCFYYAMLHNNYQTLKNLIDVSFYYALLHNN